LAIYKYFYAALAGAVVDYAMFYFSFSVGANVYQANTLAFLCGTYVNYLVCKKYVFNSDGVGAYKFVLKFVLTYAIVILASKFILLTSFYIGVYNAKLSTYPLTFLLNFYIRKLIIFKKI
jgi:putative flippase GtrA